MPLSHYCRRGVLISSDRESDRVHERKLRTCCHCRFTWTDAPGSRRLRGFCTRCMGDVCGNPACVARGCLHHERMLELMEQGWPWELLAFAPQPVTVAVTTEPPRA